MNRSFNFNVVEYFHPTPVRELLRFYVLTKAGLLADYYALMTTARFASTFFSNGNSKPNREFITSPYGLLCFGL